ncbi:hypothetical protein ON010_g12281 [Phytophthora cinnamomi]|nr:hypothetical protein ON010_g12281 [Phytophthora cinnamomi]
MIASGEKALNEDADDKARLEWKQKQTQIKRMVLGSVSLALAQRVVKKKTGTDMWKELLEYYEDPSNQVLVVHKRQLLHKLWHTRASKGEDMMLHVGKMMNIRDQLTVLKYPVHDVDMVDALLNSLPHNDKYQRLAQLVRLGVGGQSKAEEIRDLLLIPEAQLKDEAGGVFGARGAASGMTKQAMIRSSE